jgi:hypothetical protein
MTHHTSSNNEQNETRKKVFVSHARILSEEQRSSLSDKEKEYEASCKSRGVWLEIFCPDDQCLREEERFEVPIFCEDPKAGKKLWLKLFCPEGSCEITSPTQLP